MVGIWTNPSSDGSYSHVPLWTGSHPSWEIPMKQPCVYILASRRNGTLYVGITTDLTTRMVEHDQCLMPGFTARYGVRHLVYYEHHASIPDAIKREKALKRWNRQWKLRLIESMNPGWTNLYDPTTGEIAFAPFDHPRSRS